MCTLLRVEIQDQRIGQVLIANPSRHKPTSKKVTLKAGLYDATIVEGNLIVHALMEGAIKHVFTDLRSEDKQIKISTRYVPNQGVSIQERLASRRSRFPIPFRAMLES